MIPGLRASDGAEIRGLRGARPRVCRVAAAAAGSWEEGERPIRVLGRGRRCGLLGQTGRWRELGRGSCWAKGAGRLGCGGSRPSWVVVRRSRPGRSGEPSWAEAGRGPSWQTGPSKAGQAELGQFGGARAKWPGWFYYFSPWLFYLHFQFVNHS